MNYIYRYSCLIGAIILAVLSSSCKKQKQESFVDISFRSKPEAVKVFLGSRELGETPFEKRFRTKNRKINLVLKFAKEGHESVWKKFLIPAKGKVIVEASLAANTGSYMINSKPPGANIVFQGRAVGATPYIIKDLKAGRYSATLKKVNFEPITINWEVKDGRPQRRDVSLESNIGKLRMTSSPSKATILINNEMRGLTPYTTDIEEGEYRVEIRKAGHAPFKDSVTVERGKSASVRAELQVLPGVLNVSSTPRKANVFINDKPFNQTPVVARDLSPGVYKVRVEKEGYDPDIRDVEVMAGRTVEVNAQLDSNRGGIDLAVVPAGVTVYLDGKKIGITKDGVFEVRNLSMGRHKIKLAHKRATPQVKEFWVKVRKGMIERPPKKIMWIADTFLELKDGTQMTGRMRADNKIGREIMFEREPGITQSFKYSEIKKRVPLKLEE